jgi:regulator of protease activity HflC (stomatin/prohibitin superfamily)
MYNPQRPSPFAFLAVVLILGLLLAGCIALWMWGYPKYRVYSQEMAGRALLAEAESSRQIAVLEARAKLDSAKSLAAAEVERAKGVAEANKIIGDSLRNNEDYLRYLFVNGLENTKNQVIYVPTETNLPILEANRGSRAPAQ